MTSKNSRSKTRSEVVSPQNTAAAAAVVSAPSSKTPAEAAVAKHVVAAPAAKAPIVEVRDRSTVAALIVKLRDPEADVARDAAATLGRLPIDAQAVDALCDVVRNANGYFHPVVRTAAAAALGLLRDRRALDALVVATGDTMAEASEEAVKALGLLGDVRALPALEKIIRNEQGYYLENVRQTAQDAAKRIKSSV